MDLWAAVLKILGLKGGATDEFKAIVAAYKKLNDDYRIRIEELEMEIKKFQFLKPETMNDTDVTELIEREKEYLQQIIVLITENRDLKEQLIFIPKLKNGKH